MKKVKGLLFFCSITLHLSAQNGFLQGKVANRKTSEPLIGVNVVVDDTTGTVSDINGNYSIGLAAGTHKIAFRFVGYKMTQRFVKIVSTETVTLNVDLEENITELDVVVVSAGKFEQKIEEVTVSMEVIKPQLISNKNTFNLETFMDQVPGVNVIDGQCNIRGGSGYSYGAGSRVLVLVDDLPMLAADANDIKWNFLPVENLEQIEVIKGASSALFGSSALNGVINIRTAYPKDMVETSGGKKGDSETSFNLSRGLYWEPVRRDTNTGTFRDTLGKFYRPLRWWESSKDWWKISNPVFTGVSFMHSHKIDNLDLVLGGNVYTDEGYRQGENEQWVKSFINTRYRFKNIPGLSVGVNGTFMKNNGGWFFFWEDADSGAYRPKGGIDPATTTLSTFTTSRTNIDPYFIYFSDKIGKHSLRSRYLNTTNINNTNQGAVADNYYTEYQYQKQFKKNLTLTSGLLTAYTVVKSELYGNHYGSNYAWYFQGDKRFNRLSVSMGIRGEYYRIDTAETVSSFSVNVKGTTIRFPFQPVIRSGLNYRVFEETYLRTSFGQGYRFPSMAEKFINTSVSSIVVLPNPALQPEKGWSGEFGIKQGFKISDWKGFIDVAGFWTEYQDMIEFMFGKYYPDWIDADSMENSSLIFPYLINHGVIHLKGPIPTPLQYDTLIKAYLDTVFKYTGFKFFNIGRSQIKGFEVSIAGTGKIGHVTVNILGGYTYMIPINFNRDRAYTSLLSDSTSNLLKYRFRHNPKLDIQLVYKQFSLGWSARYTSYISNIDLEFEDPLVMEGVKQYRQKHNKGDLVLDLRASYQMSDNSKVSLVSNNILNREYMGRPGDMQPPRTVALQYSLKF